MFPVRTVNQASLARGVKQPSSLPLWNSPTDVYSGLRVLCLSFVMPAVLTSRSDSFKLLAVTLGILLAHWTVSIWSLDWRYLYDNQHRYGHLYSDLLDNAKQSAGTLIPFYPKSKYNIFKVCIAIPCVHCLDCVDIKFLSYSNLTRIQIVDSQLNRVP